MERQLTTVLSLFIEELHNNSKILTNHREIIVSNSEISSNQSNAYQSEYFTEVIQDIDNKMTEIESVTNELNYWLENNENSNLFGNFTDIEINKLDTTAIRVLCLLFFNNVDLNLSDGSLSIEYRLTPFAALENHMSRITEYVKDLQGHKTETA
ncbi:hypothetical protein [Pseudalkalibacillus sp. NRS-1564]|uniref:hypothetical protein n=1 Tax=Pseudalkalibacillus sp. NRS-1564 TaxID=3233900 RepID=UPI003D28DD48